MDPLRAGTRTSSLVESTPIEGCPPSLRRALRHCADITYASRNHLARAAERLHAPTKRNLFVASYAAMRVVDDAVDDGFLGLDGEVRDAQRSRWLGRLEDWLRQAELCAGGTWRATREPGGFWDERIFAALDHFVGRSEIGVEPWRRLIDSLASDVREQELDTWDDYLAYCEGACVAPACVFVYILGCEVSDDDRTLYRLPHDCVWYARDLAIFSYLVHMARDLRLDAARDPQLLALPRRALREQGLGISEARAAILGGDRVVVGRLLAEVREMAEHYRDRSQARLARAATDMDPRDFEVLESVSRLYLNTYQQLDWGRPA